MDRPLFVRQDDVPLRWHEAVALVRCVTDALEDGRIRSVPTPDELALESDGSLHVPAQAFSATANRTLLASQLCELLRGLLPPDAPSELRAIVELGDRNKPIGTLEDFRQALAMFERPSHEKDRRSVAARLSEVREERQLESEIERLRRKARTEEEPHADSEHPRSPAPKRKSFRNALVVLAVLVLASVAALAMVFSPASVRSSSLESDLGQTQAVETQPTKTQSAQTQSAEPQSPKKGLIEKLRDVAKSAFGTPAAAPKTTVATTGDAAPAIPRPRAARRPSRATTPPSRPQPPPKSSAALQADVLAMSAFVPSFPRPEPSLPEFSTLIHDRRDQDIIAPVLLRPHLPSVGSLGNAGTQPGTVEVVVAQDGRVEQVRLVQTSAERRYYDAMILAAVKAWVFRPATRSGQPVRYRLQIPLT